MLSTLKRLWSCTGVCLSISYLPVITICGVDPAPMPGSVPDLKRKPWEFFPPLREPEGRRPFAVVWPRSPYPLEARMKHHEGTALLELRVRGDGSVGSVHVVKSSGHRLLDQTAITNFQKWRFKPGCADRLRTVIRYTLHCPGAE